MAKKINFNPISGKFDYTEDISGLEPALGNPAADGYVLSSTIAGVRSWIAAGAGDMILASIQTITGAKTFGTIGGAVGKLILAGSTSGSSILNAAAVAGTTTITLPASTGTLALTDQTMYIGTTAVAINRASAALTLAGLTLTTPILGVASATSLATSAATPLKLTNAYLVDISLTAQTVGATTLTIPDFASVVDEFTFKTKAQTMSNKTFVAPALGTPASGALTNCTFPTLNQNTTGSSGSCTGNSATVTTNANLTGIVTSVGNATAIADKAISTAKLADGTDGELITWDANGVIAKVAVGTAAQVLTSNGVGTAPTFQDAGGGGATDIFDRFRNFSDYNASGYGTDGVGTETITLRGAQANLGTGSTADDTAYIYQNSDFYYLWYTGKETTIDFSVKNYSHITAQEVLFYLADALTATSNGIGFRVTNADLFAKNADGTTETVTDTTVDIVTGDQHNRYTAKVVPGTNCKFYVNGVLKATHTTNLPAVGTYWGRPRIQIKTTEAVAKTLWINRTLVEIETY